MGGVTNSTGRLEFCARGIWGRVCNKKAYWDLDNAKVVCRQLGFSGEGRVYTRIQHAVMIIYLESFDQQIRIFLILM